jgi:hypothetical protein
MTTPSGAQETPPPHLHFILKWSTAVLFAHGQYFKQHPDVFGPPFRALQKNMLQLHESLNKICTENEAYMDYLGTSSTKRDVTFPNEETESQVDFPPLQEEDPVASAGVDLPGWY